MSRLPAVGVASPAQSRSSVVFPEPFGPVTSRKPPREVEVEPLEHALVAVALAEPAGADHLPADRVRTGRLLAFPAMSP